MILVNVIRNGVVTNSNKKQTQAEIDSWLEEQKAQNSFGKNERWVHEFDLAAKGEDKLLAIESQDVAGPIGEEPKKVYKFAAEYTIEQVDITVQVQAEIKLNKRLNKQSFGAYLIAKITEMNDGAALTSAQLSALLGDTEAAKLERLLWSGSLDFAKAAIQMYSGPLYSEVQKAALVAEINAYLLANP